MRVTGPRTSDQTGRKVVVTGANSGIGFEAARALAAAGAHVVMACRSRERGEAAAARIEGSTEVRELDTSSLASVRAFADATTSRIDVLVNNAGIGFSTGASRTTDGFETVLATNYLGAFALTALLLDRIDDRVVMTSSIAHRFGVLHLDDPQWQRRSTSGADGYAQSKLAALMLAYELQHRLTAAGSSLRAFAAHPGLAATAIGQRRDAPPSVLARLARPIARAAGQDQRQGALPTVLAATDPDLPGGTYVGPAWLAELQGPPVPVGSSRASHDRAMQRLLVAASERVTGIDLVVPR